MMLVTLQEAKDHLRIDIDAGDADLTLKIHVASGAVLNYLKGANILEPQRNEAGVIELSEAGTVVYTTDLRFEVRAAVLLMLGYLFKDRDNDENREYEQGYLPRPVTALLYSLRDPTIA